MSFALAAIRAATAFHSSSLTIRMLSFSVRVIFSTLRRGLRRDHVYDALHADGRSGNFNDDAKLETLIPEDTRAQA